MNIVKIISIFIGTLMVFSLVLSFIAPGAAGGANTMPGECAIIVFSCSILSTVFLTSKKFPKLAKLGDVIALFFFVFLGLCVLSAFLFSKTSIPNPSGSWYFWLLFSVSTILTAAIKTNILDSISLISRKQNDKKAYTHLPESEQWKLERETQNREQSKNQITVDKITDTAEPVTPNPYSGIDIPRIIKDENEWRRIQRGLSETAYELNMVDAMDGREFEYWCADLLEKTGFSNVEVTVGSGDQGVDVLAQKDGIRYAVQCKCYSHDLGNKPIQEVNAGRNMPQYRCQIGVVMTNRYFTKGAKDLADATGVLLWDRDKLVQMLESSEA